MSENVGNILPMIMIRYMSVQRGFTLALSTSGTACLIVLYSELYDAPALAPVGILGIKMGLSCAFSFLYFASIDYFESQFLGLQMGVCNVIARGSTIAAPIIAELPDPIPMMTMIILLVTATILSC